jgi:diaminopimelate decarboxylase
MDQQVSQMRFAQPNVVLQGSGPPVALSTERVDQFLADERPTTPCIVLDLAIVRAQYQSLQQFSPRRRLYYAVKANPAAEVVSISCRSTWR